MNVLYYNKELERRRSAIPAQCLGIKILVMSVVYDDDIVLFVQITLERSLRVPGEVTFIAALVCRPPERIRLCVFFTEYK